MPDEPDSTTVLDRFLAAGISRESFDRHLAAGRVLVNGKVVSDAATPAAKPIDVGIGLGTDAPQR